MEKNEFKKNEDIENMNRVNSLFYFYFYNY